MGTAAKLDAQDETELEMMKGIVTLLLSLAGLCVLASLAPHPVRCFVLWLMRRAETVVRDWVYCSEDEYWPAAIRAGNEPSDALLLAASLRELARSVRKMAAEYRRFIRRCERSEAGEADGLERNVAARSHRIGTVRELLSRISFLAAPCPDTS